VQRRVEIAGVLVQPAEQVGELDLGEHQLAVIAAAQGRREVAHDSQLPHGQRNHVPGAEQVVRVPKCPQRDLEALGRPGVREVRDQLREQCVQGGRRGTAEAEGPVKQFVALREHVRAALPAANHPHQAVMGGDRLFCRSPQLACQLRHIPAAGSAPFTEPLSPLSLAYRTFPCTPTYHYCTDAGRPHH
jgi:hypothetical protein